MTATAMRITRNQFINLFLSPFGRCRVHLGNWPHADLVATAISTIRDNGGLDWDQSDTPGGELKNVYFRLHGRRICLSIEDYGDVSLWGPKAIVSDLSHAIARSMDGSEQEPNS